MPEAKGYIRTSDEKGSVNISQSVVTTIAAAAAVDIDGVYALYQTPGKELADQSGKKGISKGVKTTIEEGCITTDVFIIAEVGFNISEVAALVQKAVITSVEEAVGAKVKTVNVHVGGVSMKKTKPQTHSLPKK